jgi:squalene synthase HpnC
VHASSEAEIGLELERSGLLPTPAAVMARRHGENFPVALRLLPGAMRGHLLALYGFARLVDDAGDEVRGDRLALLDALDRGLDRLFAGSDPGHPLLRRLALSVRACDLPEVPLRRLVEANRRDQRVARYERYEDLLDYCRDSADPVGRLVLQIFGAATPERLARSDAICSALQLVEHWHDVAEDFGRGRIYLPLEDLRRFGCRESDLGVARATPALRRCLEFEVARTRELLVAGAPLVDSLQGWARLAVAGFAAGGHAALDAVAVRDFDVLASPPRTRRTRWLRHWFVSLLGGRWA